MKSILPFLLHSSLFYSLLTIVGIVIEFLTNNTTLSGEYFNPFATFLASFVWGAPYAIFILSYIFSENFLSLTFLKKIMISFAFSLLIALVFSKGVVGKIYQAYSLNDVTFFCKYLVAISLFIFGLEYFKKRREPFK